MLDDEGPPISRGPDPSVYGPTQAVPREPPPIPAPDLRPPSPEAARGLDAGEVGVVDITGAVAIRPAELETARGARLEQLRWTRWGRRDAVGSGELHLLSCQPTCANGRTERIPATIRLTGVRRCNGRRYFAAGEVEIDPARTPSGEQPATYVRAPC